MTYSEATEYLFNSLPVFQNAGPGAYKPGLERVLALSEKFGNPHIGLPVIHIAGTNGKGSTAHTLAAILQSAGYRTGLYTSPHLVDFRERIRIDGRMIGREEVVDFTERFRAMAEDIEPSFFELATVMAFEHFKRNNVDVAVVETGLGGRLDSTNIVSPVISIITNISLDHTGLLGATPAEIAKEKAGIIKPDVPVVVGNAYGAGVRGVFAEKAQEEGSELIFAAERPMFSEVADGQIYKGTPWGDVKGELTGECQCENANTVMHALNIIADKFPAIDAGAVRQGFSEVCSLTGLMGRWMHIDGTDIETVCDTGHNPGGWTYLAERLKAIAETRHVYAILGFVNDKDISTILRMLPRGENITYLFVKASVARALPSETLAVEAAKVGITGRACGSVAHGYETALSLAAKGDFIFMGGSTFVVADLLSERQ